MRIESYLAPTLVFKLCSPGRDEITESTSFEKPLLWKDNLDLEDEEKGITSKSVLPEKSALDLAAAQVAKINQTKDDVAHESVEAVLEQARIQKELKADLNNEFTIKTSKKVYRLRAPSRAEMMYACVANTP